MKELLSSDQTILLTGSTGMLGSYLKLLLSALTNYQVLSPSRHELDLLSQSSTKAYISRHKPHIVIHLSASVFGLGGNINRPLKALTDNSCIDNCLFEALVEFPPEHIFYASTVAGYGYPFIGTPLQEDNFFEGTPHHGEYGYAMAKTPRIQLPKALKSSIWM